MHIGQVEAQGLEEKILKQGIAVVVGGREKSGIWDSNDIPVAGDF